LNTTNSKKYKNDIVVYENFLTAEECDAVMEYWKYCVEKGTLTWNPISFYDSYASNLPDDVDMLKFGLPRDFFGKLEKGIQEATELARGGGMKKVSYHAQKWIEGAFADFHSDNSTNGEYNAFERSKWASFLYINDDFEGGALNFKDDSINIIPKKGMLAAFAGGHHNEHQVTKVLSGNRYTIGSFWDYAESEYSKEKRAEWEAEIAAVRAQQADQHKDWVEKKEKGIRIQPREEY
jgi:hypothetical protein